jgi:hypothetical protein
MGLVTGISAVGGYTVSAAGTIKIDSGPAFAWTIAAIPPLPGNAGPVWGYHACFQPPIAVNQSGLSVLTIDGNYNTSPTANQATPGWGAMTFMYQSDYNTLPWDHLYDGPALSQSSSPYVATGSSGGLYVTQPMTFQKVEFFVSGANEFHATGTDAHDVLVFQSYAALSGSGLTFPFTATVGGNSYSVTVSDTQPTSTIALPSPVTVPAGQTQPVVTWTMPLVTFTQGANGRVYIAARVS